MVFNGLSSKPFNVPEDTVANTPQKIPNVKRKSLLLQVTIYFILLDFIGSELMLNFLVSLIWNEKSWGFF